MNNSHKIFSFADAFILLEKGKKVKRTDWKGVYLKLVNNIKANQYYFLLIYDNDNSQEEYKVTTFDIVKATWEEYQDNNMEVKESLCDIKQVAWKRAFVRILDKYLKTTCSNTGFYSKIKDVLKKQEHLYDDVYLDEQLWINYRLEGILLYQCILNEVRNNNYIRKNKNKEIETIWKTI